MDPELIAYLDSRFAFLDSRFAQQDARFTQLDQRFEAIGQRFEAIDQRFEAIDRRFDDVQQDVREVHILVEEMDRRVELVAEGVMANTERIRDLRSEMERQFDEVKAVNRFSYAELDRKLRDHDRRITDLEAR